ncbi:MAG: CHAT domain-containing protein, partial [Saprospiraceae bacterium]|nr:CHAT domain-containing protein [Saprospiraceae bacterium]
ILLDRKSHQKNSIQYFSNYDLKRFKELERKKTQLNKLNSENLELVDTEINSLFRKYSDSVDLKLFTKNYIEFYYGDSIVYIFSDIENQKVFKELGTTKDFKDQLKNFKDYINNKSSENSILNTLYTFLLPKEIKIINKISILPDGPICFIPFEILKNPKGEFLIQNSIINYKFSHHNIIRQQQNRIDNIFILAPEYSKPSIEIASLTRNGFNKLEFNKNEIDDISQSLGLNDCKFYNLTKSEIIDKIYSSSIFHFAGHATVEDNQALLAINDSNTLTSNEISQLTLDLDLAVLSACETGLGSWTKGEGVQSMGRAFHEAGVRSSIFSLWSVNDQSSSMIMKSLYNNLKIGCSKDDALRKSKLQYLENAMGLDRHPFFWSGFITYGDTSSLRFADNNNYLLIIIISTFVLLILFVTIKKRSI